MTLPAGTRFELVTDAGTKDKGYHVSGSEDLVFEGFGRAPNGDARSLVELQLSAMLFRFSAIFLKRL